MSVTKQIRILQAASKFGVGASHIVDFLKNKGFTVTPASKLTDEQYDLLAKEYEMDIALKERASHIKIDVNRNVNSLVTIEDLIAEQKILECSLNQSFELDLSYNSLTKIPENLQKLIWLKKLILKGNEINKIEGLENLTQLSELNLSNNKIEKIEGLENLTQLSVLDLGFNQISKIEGLEKLKQLSSLFLRNNQISKIEGLEDLTLLSFLHLGNNQIEKIEGLEYLKQLSDLHLHGNQVRKIEGLENLTQIKILGLNNNQIEKIEGLNIKLLEQLYYINLRNNPLEKNIPINDFTNLKVIAGYLRSLEEDNTKKVINQHIKVNIIGHGRIGKTQLLNFLSKGEFENNAAATHGMNQCNYTIQKSKVEASLWDFGGQEYHHGTHALFLRKKDFYIALWRYNTDKPTDYGYWLGTARNFAPTTNNIKPPLLLVQQVWSENEDVLHYPDSKKAATYQISLDDIYAIDVKKAFKKDAMWLRKWQLFQTELNEKIIAHAHSFGEIPIAFSKVRSALSKKPINKINLLKNDFLIQYAENVDSNLHDYLIDYLEFTGALLYFNEIPELQDKIFPNPVGLSKWIYETILDETTLQNDRGIITETSLAEKLKINESPENQEQLKSFHLLAQHFQLYFKEPFAKETTYVIPQYLPAYEHSFKKVLLELLPYTFCLHYPDFIHEGRFFTFIASYGQFALDSTAYWKYGLLFRHAETQLKALVYYVADERKIMIHIEDKKGKTTLAQELFNYFAFKEPISKITMHPEYKGAESREYKKGKPNIDFYMGLQISTNGNHFWEVTETIQNINANVFYGICTKTQKRIKLDYMAINLLGNDERKKLRVFFSYSHKDEQYKNELDVHFAMLKRMGRIETWNDRKILAGEEWNEKIKNQLQEADIVLLMISADFLHSEYIWNEELGIIRERLNNNDSIVVIPIFIRPCDTTEFDMMRFQGAQKDKSSEMEYISSSPDKDRVYANIVKEIRSTIESMK